MAAIRSAFAIWFAALLLPSSARHMYEHAAVDLDRRQAPPSTPVAAIAAATSLPPGVLTIITPSPGAAPVSVTQQSQVVTSFVPQFTLCELPPIAFFPNPVPQTSPTTAPYLNYSISTPTGTGTCETIYSETQTTVCATTLSGLVDEYPVSECDDQITFASEYGYVLAYPTPTIPTIGNGTYTNSSMASSVATITPAPTIQTLTTYWVAPWQEFTTAGPPTDVDRVVCTTYTNGTRECIRESQFWETELITIMTSTVTNINVSTTIYGPSQVIFATIIAANVTEQLTTLSLTTRLALEYETEITTTNVMNRTVSTAPTVYQTQTVEEAPDLSTTTITQRLTRITVAGTTTISMLDVTPTPEAAPAPAAAPAAAAPTVGDSNVDFASMLGIDAVPGA